MKTRIVALGMIAWLVLTLGYLNLRSADTLEVPAGARPGSLIRDACTYTTEAGDLPADCGTLVVPENRRDPNSDLIALPVIRIRATGERPAEPTFRLNGGPGATNLEFPQASRLTRGHDLVLVGYRGVDGSRRLDCPEVSSTLKRSADLGIALAALGLAVALLAWMWRRQRRIGWVGRVPLPPPVGLGATVLANLALVAATGAGRDVARAAQ
jgi:hypothetical protein